MGKVIGIDLGTTNSCVAVYEVKGPVVIPNRGGYPTTPSIVGFAENGKRLVGHIAKRQVVTNALNTVVAAKRLIGRRFNSPEVRRIQETSAFQIVEGPNTEARVEVGGRVFAIPEISAFVLMEMRKIAEDYLGEPVEQAVVTVPAYFNDAQRQATKAAGAIAGLDIIRIINEPTAAAIAYGMGRTVESTIMVFDLGGGTFDVSVLSISEGVYEVLSTAGDTFLGGIDFDNKLIEHLADSFQRQHGMDLRTDRIALQRLKEAAENAKCELSSKKMVEVTLPFIASRDGQPIHLQISVSRAEFEAMVGPLVERCLDITRQAVAQAGLKLGDVDEILLVGGQTRTPLVQSSVQRLFGKGLSKGLNPDEVVAQGAAAHAHTLTSEEEPTLLLDVTPMSLGIATVGGGFSTLIPRNTTIPTSKTHSFTTVNDNQSAVKIVVLQGESDRAARNQLLGEFMLSGIRPAPKGVPDVEVTFTIDSDGIVSVSARDRDTGKQQDITVTLFGGLSEDEMARMIEERQEYEVQQRQEEDTQALSYRVERLVLDLEKLLKKAGPALEGDRYRTILGHIEDARRALKSRDADALQRCRGQLEMSHDSLQAVQDFA